MNKLLRTLAGFIISGVCLWLTFRNFHFIDLVDALKNALWIWILPALMLYLTGYFFRTLRWRLLLSPLKKLPLKKVFPVLMFGFLMNNVLPARAGEFARAYAGNRTTGLPTSSLFGSVALERLTDLAGVLFLIGLCYHLLPMDKLPITLVFAALVGGCVFAGGILYLIEKKKEFLKKYSSGFLGKVISMIQKVTEGFSAVKSPTLVISVFIISIFIWMLEAGSMFLFSWVFQINLTYLQSCALLVGLSMGVMIPAAPGFVGTYEFFGKEMFKYLGFPAQVSLPYLLVLHFIQILVTVVGGLPMLIKLGIPSQEKLDASVPTST